MSEWLWVVLGYSVAYLAIATYVGITVHGWLRAQRQMEGRR